MKKYLHGDTLIEVMISVTIFSLVAVSGISIMNQGTSTAQRSLEITLVKQEIDAQAEALRFMNAAYLGDYHKNQTIYTGFAQSWVTLRNKISTADVVSNFGVDPVTNKCPARPTKSYIVNTRTLVSYSLTAANYLPNPVTSTYARVIYDPAAANPATAAITVVDGIWIEAVKSSRADQTNADYIDFHIRACWNTLGQTIPMTLGTIVRLYESI